MVLITHVGEKRKTNENRKRYSFGLKLENCKKLCVSGRCGQFNQFIYVKRDIVYLHFACPKCGEVIQVPRLTTPKDNRK